MRSDELIQDKKNLIECDVIKTLMMLLVVLGHSSSLWSPNGWFITAPVFPSKMLGMFADWVGSFHIYCFVLVSGYIFAYLKYEYGKYNDWKQLLYSKFRRLIVPYIFVSVFWAAPIYLYFYKCGFISVIIKFALGTGPSQLWFLLMLFQLFLYAQLFSNLFIKKTKLVVIISLFLYAVSLVGNNFIQNFFQIFTSMQFYLFFMVGMALRYFKEIFKVEKIGKAYLFILVLADVILFIINKALNHQNTYICKMINLGCTCVLHLVGAVMAFYIVFSIAKIVPIWKSKLFQILNKHSFVVYLFHQQIIYFCIYLFNGKIHNSILFFLSFISSVVISILISVILTQNKFTVKLIGVG